MTDLTSSGSLVGRFFRVHTPPTPGTDLRLRAQAVAWTPESSRELARQGKEQGIWLCTSSPPHDGRLLDDDAPLSGHDEGRGFWRLWVREDLRAPSRTEVAIVAEQICRQTRHSSLREQPRPVRDQVLADARLQVMQRMSPEVRVHEVWVHEGRLWVGRTDAHASLAWRALFHGLFGVVEPDPLVWTEDGPGWSALSRAAVESAIRQEDGAVGHQVILGEVTLQESSLRLRSSELVDHRETLRHVLSLPSPPTFSRLIFHVVVNGSSSVEVLLDEHGVRRVTPPSSRGGLIGDRLTRRFHDALDGCERLREVLHEAFASLTGVRQA